MGRAAAPLSPRHSYIASTPFLHCFYAILTLLPRHSYKVAYPSRLLPLQIGIVFSVWRGNHPNYIYQNNYLVFSREHFGNAFRHTELVITDRLHGMIFSAITGTPCIVINSKSPKVRGCYEWIRHLDYIQFCDDVSRIKDIYEKMEKKKYEYDNNRLRPFYDSLKKDLLQAVRRK